MFSFPIGSSEPVDLELPNQWLWDIIDEFIYQVRVCCVGVEWALLDKLHPLSFSRM